MKKAIYLLMFLSVIGTSTITAQNCKAEFIVNKPQCKYVFENTSDIKYQFYWNINGQLYYNRFVELNFDAYEILHVCLYVKDSINNCSDTFCMTLPGKKKLKFDYYVYKQQLYLTSLVNGEPGDVLMVDYGDNHYDNSPVVGVFKHTYANPGKYKVRLYLYDSMEKGKRCAFEVSDSIKVDGNSKCRSYFISYVDSSVKDSILLFNRSVGEFLSYYWDLGDGNSSTERFPMHTYQVTKRANVCLTIVDTVNHCVSTYCDSLSVVPGFYFQTVSEVVKDTGGGVSIGEHVFKGKVLLYPNPFQTSIEVSIPALDVETNWEIMNSNGQSLIKGSMPASSTMLKLDLELLNKGLYILILHSGHSFMVQKLIKID